MVKARTFYICRSCGCSASQWHGKCPECTEWNSMVEQRRPGGKDKGLVVLEGHGAPAAITSVGGGEQCRIPIGLGELDRVLGAGMVPGGCVLVGGDPGIGKSTLMLQAMGLFAKAGHRVLYISGEESVRQIKLRAERLGAISENLLVWGETCAEAIAKRVAELRPEVFVIDSVQTLHSESLDSTAGSVAQVRESSMRLITVAKALDIPLFLVGHVTKDGAIAGPRVLEHMVDTVLYFEGESAHIYRILRAVKNRYGSAMEIGVFEMQEGGLRQVDNPSEVFLAERPQGASGSSVLASIEGTRTLLVEVQALVSPALFGVPRRTVVGVDYNKVLLLSAVLEKKAAMVLANHDIFVKVAGGIKIAEPAADLAIVVSLASNLLEKAVASDIVVFGEVGLAGELRGVTRAESRVREGEKLGFKRCILPKDSLKGFNRATGDMELIGASTVKEALDIIFN